MDHIIGNDADIPGKKLTSRMTKFVDELPIDVSVILNTICNSGGGVWIVGGAVRDVEMGISPTDIDLATDLTPDILTKIFPNSIETGVSFGTITIKSGNYLIQTTTLRTDGKYIDGRRPESVEWSKLLSEDLKRRDFTINSLAIDVARRLYYDPHSGIKDIQNRIIRSVGNPLQRISEDSLRILRAYRFLGQFNVQWHIEPELSIAISNNRHLISELAKERIWQELKKIMSGKVAHEIISLMIKDKVMAQIISWQSIDTETMTAALKNSESLDYISLFVLLTYDMKTDDVGELCKHLTLSKKDTKSIIFTKHMTEVIPKKDLQYLRLYRHICDQRLTQIINLATIFCEHKLSSSHASITPDYLVDIKKSLQKLAPLSVRNQIVDGNWIMANTKIKQGRKLGRLKEWLYRIQIENDLATIAEIELVLVKLHWEKSDFESWPRMKLK